MFGYIKPFKAELKVKEWEAYQGIYCGLCKQLAQRYGLFARMTLNYDFVFLAMMDMALREQRIHFCQCNCITHPFKKRTCCQSNQSLELCCDIAMLLTCYKLEDDLADEGLLRRTAVRLVLPFARRDRKKAAQYRPQLAEQMQQLMQQQNRLEQEGCAQVDLAALWNCQERNSCRYSYGTSVFYYSDRNDDGSVCIKYSWFLCGSRIYGWK